MINFTRQQLRRSACMALFAWVFALLSGVANACLIQTATPGAALFGPVKAAPLFRAAAELAPGDRPGGHAHHHADDDGGPAPNSGQAGCLKFCADESSALAKSKASYADLAAPMVLAIVHWQLATPVAAAAPWQPVERPASVGPPLFIRLLRLTI